MVRRPTLAYTVALVAAACHAPHSRCVTTADAMALHATTAADILFVVDDSNSMDPRQANLTANFGAFMDVLDGANRERVSAGAAPLELHLAVTTSSVFMNAANGSSCGDVQAGLCCDPGGSTNTPLCHACPSWSSAGTVQCGQYSASFPDASASIWQGCTNPSNIAQPGQPYPRGDFVARPGNPKVIHFTADLWTDPAKAGLVKKLTAEFEQNVYVGSCGSGEEQHLSAARMAIAKVLAGQQPDIGGDEFLHPNAKLVVVWLGDEDDCSNPASGSERDDGIILMPDPTYWDSCMALEGKPNDPHIKVDDFFSFFNGLNLDAESFGFITSVADGSCAADSPGDPNTASWMCQPGVCRATACPGQPSPSACDGVSPGNRFHALAQQLRGAGRQVVMGSICDSDFSSTLARLAGVTLPIDAWVAPSVPSPGGIHLGVVESSGAIARTCRGPAASAAATASNDWWYVDGSGAFSATPTRYVHVDPSAGCTLAQLQSYALEPDSAVTSCK